MSPTKFFPKDLYAATNLPTALASPLALTFLRRRISSILANMSSSFSWGTWYLPLSVSTNTPRRMGC